MRIKSSHNLGLVYFILGGGGGNDSLLCPSQMISRLELKVRGGYKKVLVNI